MEEIGGQVIHDVAVQEALKKMAGEQIIALYYATYMQMEVLDLIVHLLPLE